VGARRTGEGAKKSPPLGEGARRAGEGLKKSPPFGEGVRRAGEGRISRRIYESLKFGRG